MLTAAFALAGALAVVFGGGGAGSCAAEIRCRADRRGASASSAGADFLFGGMISVLNSPEIEFTGKKVIYDVISRTCDRFLERA